MMPEKNQKEVEEHKLMTVSDSEIMNFYSSWCEMGRGDVVFAIAKFKEVGLDEYDLAEEIREFCKGVGKVKPRHNVCYLAYQRILFEARNKIFKVIDFDILEHNGIEFCIAGSDIDTFYGHSTEEKDWLEGALRKATQKQLDELTADKFVQFFLVDVEIDIEQFRKELEDEK